MISLPMSNRARRDLDDPRSDDDHQQCREEAQDQREGDLNRYFLRLPLGPLTAPHPHLLSLLTQYMGNRNAQLSGLNHGGDECA